MVYQFKGKMGNVGLLIMRGILFCLLYIAPIFIYQAQTIVMQLILEVYQKRRALKQKVENGEYMIDMEK